MVVAQVQWAVEVAVGVTVSGVVAGALAAAFGADGAGRWVVVRKVREFA